MRQWPEEGAHVPGAPQGGRKQLHRADSHRVRSDHLRRREGSGHDVDAQGERPVDHAGDDARTHDERRSGIDAPVDLIGLEDRADADRPARPASSFDRIEGPRGVHRHLDEPDPSAHHRAQGAVDVPGVAISHDPEEPGGSVPSGQSATSSIRRDA